MHSLVATLIVLRLLAINFPNLYQLKFTPSEVIVTSIPWEYEQAVELAVKFVKKLICQHPLLPEHLELGSNWVAAIDLMLKQVVFYS